MAREIEMNDPELDAIMAELELETAGAVDAPAAPAAVVVEEAAAAVAAPAKREQPELPPEALKSQRVTAAQKVDAIIADAAHAAPEPSNFVVPEKVTPIADPLPWEDDPSTGEALGLPAFTMPDWSPMTGEQMKAKLKDIAGIYGQASSEYQSAFVAVQTIVRTRKAAAATPAAPATPVAAANEAAEAAAAIAEIEKDEGTGLASEASKPPAEPDTHNPRVAPGLRFSIDVDEFKRETAISDTNLSDAMMQQNSLRATYGQFAANAEAQADRVKLQAEVKEAQLYEKHRKILAAKAAAGGEKVTEKAVESAVKTDPLWLAIKNRVVEAETIASINKSLVASLNDRRDMLIQIGADRREESKGPVRVVQALHAARAGS